MVRSLSVRYAFAVAKQSRAIRTATIVANEAVCREHLRITLRRPELPPSHPGQFVHISPEVSPPPEYPAAQGDSWHPGEEWSAIPHTPMLRRAFSVAGLRRGDDGIDIDVIYRVVGKATRWMASLRPGARVSILGPVGTGFPVNESKSTAWLVAGGVGLPPMLWFAQALHEARKKAIAFCGVQSADLLPLTLDADATPTNDASEATLSAEEFSQHETPTVISTDDGSLGYCGHIGAALSAYHQANPIDANEVVVYACGPEPMLEFVSHYCIERGMECYVCMERAMACGIGTCQSCVIPVVDDCDPQGWRYRLCCREGPVFPAEDVIWNQPAKR
ncbi:MAG: dihydroorotate dehydrogenase electron transfer subunit [Phycisphaerales bacterium]|nr:MAG: dihydroorotate dehydrogenase electron transfer subunit [Phycisphaerales bacterium]